MRKSPRLRVRTSALVESGRWLAGPAHLARSHLQRPSHESHYAGPDLRFPDRARLRRVYGPLDTIFGLGAAAFYFYMVIDSFQTAKAKCMGQAGAGVVWPHRGESECSDWGGVTDWAGSSLLAGQPRRAGHQPDQQVLADSPDCGRLPGAAASNGGAQTPGTHDPHPRQIPQRADRAIFPGARGCKGRVLGARGWGLAKTSTLPRRTNRNYGGEQTWRQLASSSV